MTNTIPLYRVARVIRSKNAKPYRLTLDVLFDQQKLFEYVRDTNSLSPETVAKAYGLKPEAILSHYIFEPGMAFKFTLRRPVVQGDPGDSDIYGAQQHAPLMDIEIPWDEPLKGVQLRPIISSQGSKRADLEN